MVEGRPLLNGVFVNGHGPYRFLVDTGTTLNHLDLKIAQSIGLKATFRTELISSGGVSYATGADGIEIAVGPVRSDRQTFLFAVSTRCIGRMPTFKACSGRNFFRDSISCWTCAGR